MSGDAIARERIKALLADVKRIDIAVAGLQELITRKEPVTREELDRFKEEYRRAHADLIEVVAGIRTSLAVGPAELNILARQQAIDSGRRQAFQATTTNLTGIVIAAAALGGLIGHFT